MYHNSGAGLHTVGQDNTIVGLVNTIVEQGNAIGWKDDTIVRQGNIAG